MESGHLLTQAGAVVPSGHACPLISLPCPTIPGEALQGGSPNEED